MVWGFLFTNIITVLMHSHSTFGIRVDCEKFPHITDPTTCCPIPELITEQNVDKCREYFIEPQATFVPMANEKRTRRTKTHSSKSADKPLNSMDNEPVLRNCFINCLFNDTGILANGKLNESNLSSHLKNIIVNLPDLINILENSFKICSYKANKFSESAVGSTRDVHPNSICPPIATDLSACVFMETFVNCPASVWSKTKECNDLRNHIKSCVEEPKMEDSISNSTTESKKI